MSQNRGTNGHQLMLVTKTGSTHSRHQQKAIANILAHTLNNSFIFEILQILIWSSSHPRNPDYRCQFRCPRWRVRGVHNVFTPPCDHGDPGCWHWAVDPDTETERGIRADNVFMFRQSEPRCGASRYGPWDSFRVFASLTPLFVLQQFSADTALGCSAGCRM